jgi:ADP-ribose pyrophosphatase
MKRLVKILVVVNGDILVIEQFREQINKTTIELPGGKIENSETPLEAAKRELEEETGLVCNEFKNLGCYVNSSGTIEVNLFFTNTIEKIEKQKLDIDENINVQYHPVRNVFNNIFTGRWDDIRLAMAIVLARGSGLL